MGDFVHRDFEREEDKDYRINVEPRLHDDTLFAEALHWEGELIGWRIGSIYDGA